MLPFFCCCFVINKRHTDSDSNKHTHIYAGSLYSAGYLTNDVMYRERHMVTHTHLHISIHIDTLWHTLTHRPTGREYKGPHRHIQTHTFKKEKTNQLNYNTTATTASQHQMYN